MIRKWDIVDEEIARQCKDEIITRVEEQGDAPFGVIAAQEIIDIVAEHLGPEIYSRAVEDAKKVVEKKLSDLEIDLDTLRN
jgi:uncharacterized protein (DUF2164 family)